MKKKDKELIFNSYIKWIEDGKKLTTYKCPHCKKRVCLRIPTEDLVGTKGYWDSTRMCYKCDKLSFVTVWSCGQISVKKLGR